MIKILKAIKDRLISFLNFSLLSTGSQIRFSVLNTCNKDQFREISPAVINKINVIQPYFKIAETKKVSVILKPFYLFCGS